ncbi:MAG: hypothetical protein FWH55_11955, partial [Oscillospiraceae bacterium]|nr:hypothetical protein [Oscillospiraceae bacterium]
VVNLDYCYIELYGRFTKRPYNACWAATMTCDGPVGAACFYKPIPSLHLTARLAGETPALPNTTIAPSDNRNGTMWAYPTGPSPKMSALPIF